MRDTHLLVNSLLAALLVIATIPSTSHSQASDRRLRFQDLDIPDVDAAAQRQASDLRDPSISTALAGPIDAKTYRMGPGDRLQLEYTGRANQTRLLTVDGEGKLRIPNLGSIFVAGRTLDEVRTEILTDLKRFLPGAEIDLRLIEPRIFKVFVVGAVVDAGIAEVRGSARVIEALDASGGLSDGGSTRNIRVLHRDGREVVADLQRFLWTGDWDANPYLEDGDRIVVPNQTRRIFISGAVARPGPLEYREGDELTRIVEIAGGLLTEARMDSVMVIRFDEAQRLDTLVVDLSGVYSGTGEDPEIHEDDRIFIRSRVQWHPTHQANIIGEVLYPGIYAIEEGKSRISDIIAWSGGFSPNAAASNVRLLRRPEIEGQDVEFDRLSRLTRAEMTDSEYQTFRGKLAIRQAAYLIDFSTGVPQPIESDVMLKDGDVIDVERIELAIRVDGNVLRPGFIAYRAQLTVGDYLTLAGGTTARADRGGTRITRAGSNESQRAKLDWSVEPGDFVWVPEKKDTSFWDTFKDVIAVAGQMAAIIILLDTLSN